MVTPCVIRLGSHVNLYLRDGQRATRSLVCVAYRSGSLIGIFFVDFGFFVFYIFVQNFKRLLF